MGRLPGISRVTTRKKQTKPATPAALAPALFAELDPEPRLLMGPGPVDVYPRVLRAMSVPLQGQFDPQFTAYMNEAMALYRARSRAAIADGAGPGGRLSARVARHVGPAAGPVRPAVHRLHERSDGALPSSIPSRDC